MADFNFFLNRQGVRGNKGEQGEQGYSPRITVKTETASEYILNVQNEDGSYDTPNLRGNTIENLGGTYVRFNQDTEQMYTGYADIASTTSQGEVILSTYDDLDSGGDESEVTTSKDVHDFVEAKISEASVNYVDIDDYTQKMGELDSAISDLDENKLDFEGLTNTLAAGTNITITPNAQTGKITIAGEPVSQAQADWNQTDSDAPDYIKNKPTIPPSITIDDELSSTSTNPVQNRLITNAINLISNEFENYATNKLDNLSNEGETRLHALKAYSDNGELLTDEKGLLDVTKYAHSTFDRSKFTVVGSPNITNDGIASGFSGNDYIKLTPSLSGNSIKVTIGFLYNTDTGGGDLYRGMGKNASPRIITTNATNLIFYFYDGSTIIELKCPKSSFIAGKWYYTEFYISPTAQTAKVYDNDYNLIWSNSSSTALSFNVSTITSTIDIGYYNSTSYLQNSAIDLKQFSITVDGSQVFSGNKTGIDTIKPDDYTINGTPTITSDGVMTACGRLNHLSIPDFDYTKPFEVYLKVNQTSTNETRIFNFTNADTDLRGVVSNNKLSFAFRINNSVIISPTNNYILDLGVTYDIKFVYTGTKYSIYYKLPNDTNYSLLREADSTTVITTNNSATIGGRSGIYSDFTGSIDLNAFKIYVDGSLVYQPCLKIPYTESKTGSKVVDSVYRSRVNDMARQFGYANYYTLSDIDFTLPQVELYGLIERVASTIPSGVVQSSTISNIVSLTQTEYDALATKDSNTFYIITPST